MAEKISSTAADVASLESCRGRLPHYFTL